MTNWIQKDLERVAAADELQLASFKQDGAPRSPITVWVVRVDDDLYVRAYRGQETAWFKQIQRRPEGRIEADGVTKDVTFVDASSDQALGSKIDASYRSKYRRYSATYVDPMIAPQARVHAGSPESHLPRRGARDAACHHLEDQSAVGTGFPGGWWRESQLKSYGERRMTLELEKG